ncbi:MAG TPA: phosphatase PAP2 family protein [Sphaerochaeta sp.]|nr:phosphatase PAP2 family protein [Sphaerochaeta sp.]
MQETIMLFFLSIATPLLDTFAHVASTLGEEVFVIAFILFIFYNINKRGGFILFSSTLSSVVAMGTLKAIVRAPRPFQVLPSIQAKRPDTATGYSFPSGHTTTAAAAYTSAALLVGKRAFSILCAVIIALVGISRLYLGVHWPNDVFGGLVLGTSISLLAFRALGKLYDEKERSIIFSLWVGIVAAALALLLALLLNLTGIDKVAFTDLMKALSLAGGGYLGFVYERTHVNFTVEGTWVKKILRWVVGLGGIVVIMGSKALFSPAIYEISSCIRYTLIGVWATGIYPAIGIRIGLFGSDEVA